MVVILLVILNARPAPASNRFLPRSVPKPHAFLFRQSAKIFAMLSANHFDFAVARWGANGDPVRPVVAVVLIGVVATWLRVRGRQLRRAGGE
jgi:hypothetical protein